LSLGQWPLRFPGCAAAAVFRRFWHATASYVNRPQGDGVRALAGNGVWDWLAITPPPFALLPAI